jgi:hypothetical protein
MKSLSAYVEATRPFIPEGLVSAACLDEIAAVAGHCPARITNMFGFECALDTDRANADFALSMSRDSAKEHYGGATFPRTDAWNQVGAFIDQWATQSSVATAPISSICLEFDIHEGTTEAPPPEHSPGDQSPSVHSPGSQSPPSLFPPGLFLSFNDYLRARRRRPSAEEMAADYLCALDEALPSLGRKQLYDAVRPLLRKILTSLPEKSAVFQIGVMLSRPVEALRVCFTGFTADGCVEFLTAMRWHGSSAALCELLRELESRSHRFELSLDIGQAVQPKIGFEVYFDETRIVRGTPIWSPFLEYLEGKGLCTASKAQGLREYPGYVWNDPYLSLFMDGPEREIYNDPTHENDIFIKRLNHFKIVYEDDGVRQAKAYLGVVQDRLKETPSGCSDEISS